ncbi:hypothetical protein ACYPKM_00980 [Pseudomonas aeruginosa]
MLIFGLAEQTVICITQLFFGLVGGLSALQWLNLSGKGFAEQASMYLSFMVIGFSAALLSPIFVPMLAGGLQIAEPVPVERPAEPKPSVQIQPKSTSDI